MKLNLGCGNDILYGYVNVDLNLNEKQKRSHGEVRQVDLSKFPWPFADNSADEILMLDFLEHFPYRQTDLILSEVWRVLGLNGIVEVQVPDFEHTANAANLKPPFMCNKCPWLFEELDNDKHRNVCDQTFEKMSDAAFKRLYGGQDYIGNWHFTAFNKFSLTNVLTKNGFSKIEELKYNKNNETYYQNWNLKLRAIKSDDFWSDNE